MVDYGRKVSKNTQSLLYFQLSTVPFNKVGHSRLVIKLFDTLSQANYSHAEKMVIVWFVIRWLARRTTRLDGTSKTIKVCRGTPQGRVSYFLGGVDGKKCLTPYLVELEKLLRMKKKLAHLSHGKACLNLIQNSTLKSSLARIILTTFRLLFYFRACWARVAGPSLFIGWR